MVKHFELTLFGALLPIRFTNKWIVTAPATVHSRHTIQLLRKSIPSHSVWVVFFCLYAIDYQLADRVMRSIRNVSRQRAWDRSICCQLCVGMRNRFEILFHRKHRIRNITCWNGISRTFPLCVMAVVWPKTHCPTESTLEFEWIWLVSQMWQNVIVNIGSYVIKCLTHCSFPDWDVTSLASHFNIWVLGIRRRTPDLNVSYKFHVMLCWSVDHWKYL